MESLRQQISDFPLGGCATHVQSVWGHLVRGALGAQQRCPDLRTVAVSNDETVAPADDVNDCGRRSTRVTPLLANRSFLSRANQGVSANGDQHRFRRNASAQTTTRPLTSKPTAELR